MSIIEPSPDWLLLSITEPSPDCSVIGGIWGATTSENLAKNAIKNNNKNNTQPQKNTPKLEPTSQPNTSNLGASSQKNTNDSDKIPQKSNGTLTVGDRVKNTFIGASLGLLVGGGLVATAGVVAFPIVGSVTATISVLGVSSAQTFVIGAVTYNLVAMVVAPFFGIEAEPIEWE